MENPTYKIEGMTVAVNNMDAMVNFYSKVFNIEFSSNEMYGATLYSGEWGGMKVLFCPAEIAQIDVNRNRHQFDVIVGDLNQTLQIALSEEGKMLGEVQQNDEMKSGAVFDPDGNSIVFKELTK